MIYKHSLDIQCSTVADKMKLFCCHGNQIHLATKKIHFLGQEVFVCQIRGFYVLKMAEKETLILLHGNLFAQQPYTEITFQVNCYLYTKSGPSTPSDSWDIEIALCCHGNLFPIAAKIWRYEGKVSAKFLVNHVKDIDMVGFL